MTVHKFLVGRYEEVFNGVLYTGDRVRLHIFHDDGTPLFGIKADINDKILNKAKDKDAMIEDTKKVLRQAAEAQGYYFGEEVN